MHFFTVTCTSKCTCACRQLSSEYIRTNCDSNLRRGTRLKHKVLTEQFLEVRIPLEQVICKTKQHWKLVFRQGHSSNYYTSTCTSWLSHSHNMDFDSTSRCGTDQWPWRHWSSRWRRARWCRAGWARAAAGSGMTPWSGSWPRSASPEKQTTKP